MFFWRKNIGAKAALKMLMKLTTSFFRKRWKKRSSSQFLYAKFSLHNVSGISFFFTSFLPFFLILKFQLNTSHSLPNYNYNYLLRTDVCGFARARTKRFSSTDTHGPKRKTTTRARAQWWQQQSCLLLLLVLWKKKHAAFQFSTISVEQRPRNVERLRVCVQ